MRCFFIGHRDAPEMIFPELLHTIERHIGEYGVTEFVVGNYGKFDKMAARAVIDLKKRESRIQLVMLLPYHPAIYPISIPAGFDDTWYPEGMEKVPYRAKIIRANQYVIDHTDYVIAYAYRSASNASNLCELAKEKGIAISNLAADKNIRNV